MRFQVLFLCLMLIPFAVAEGDATADLIRMRGAVDVAGDLAGLSINGMEAGSIEKLAIQAERGYVLTWTEEGLAAPAVEGVQLRQYTSSDHERIPADEGEFLHDIRIAGGDQAASHLLNVIGRDEVRVLFAGPGGSEVDIDQEDGLCLSGAGLTQSVCDVYREADPYPTTVTMPSPATRYLAHGGGNFIISGDLVVLDVDGIDLHGSDFDLPRGSESETGGAYEYRFSRLVLENARVQIRVDGTHDQVAWASVQADSIVDGALDLTGASGTLYFGGEPVRVDGDTTLEGVYLLHTEPGPSGMTFTVDEPIEATGDAVAPVATGTTWAWAGILSIIPLVGIGLTIRRSRAHTSMRHVERALTKGRFDRAAKLADRLIRQDPRDESAHLGRAIALTKSGRPHDAAESLGRLLKEHRPSDGTLHYTLGVALAELGRDTEAREAMADAVRRTPALLDTVAAELRPRYDTGAYS